MTSASNLIPETSSSPVSLLIFALVNAETDKIVAGFEDLENIKIIDLGKLDLKQHNIVAQVNANHPDDKLAHDSICT